MIFLRLVILSIIFISTFSVIYATEYSYEHAEELKHLIQWRDYGSDVFEEARTDNKPIFLFLTAPSWCYWCQVYESEDYLYNFQVVKIINEKFIPVYVDADQRQDLTRKYLEGGWPSTTLLTPSMERLFGYSGPRPVPNMIANLQNTIDYTNTQSFASFVSYDYEKNTPIIPTETELSRLIDGYNAYTQNLYDPTFGGFGTGIKFPQGRTLDFSLETYEITGNKEFLNMVQNTIRNQYTDINTIQTKYKLFDPIEGGFHRYATNQDWSTPHYEKMLYDNARLLKTYAHLLQITPDDIQVREVVDKTQSYVQTNWYDNVNGGFFANTDAGPGEGDSEEGDDGYYHKINRSLDKPRIEKTKYTNWNAEAIIAYLYLWNVKHDEIFKDMSSNSLDFFENKVITDFGAYHYIGVDNSTGVRGSLLDNSYSLLAFVEGYEILQKKSYLENAQKIADYSLTNLYDWNGGGFFERNSPDTQLYALGENINLSKPAEDNGIISYALSKLYTHTGNPVYLNAAIKTMGIELENVPGLDLGYYHVKTAQYILDNDLLSDFANLSSEIRLIDKNAQQSFWVTKLLDKKSSNQLSFVASDIGLDKLQAPIFILIPVALLAGFISFASPCTLPILPAYMAYTFKASKKNVKGLAIFFFLGLSIVFVLLGMSATVLGSFLKSNSTIFSQIAGIALILFGVYSLLGKGFSGFTIKQKRPTSYSGSFLFGSILGISWTPCVGPILVGILLLASTTDSTLTGGLLLFVYAIGLATPLILFSTYLEKINKEGKLWRIISGKNLKLQILRQERIVNTNSLISSLLFIFLGYLIFSGVLFTFNQYLVTTDIQQWMFGIEERILNFLK